MTKPESHDYNYNNNPTCNEGCIYKAECDARLKQNPNAKCIIMEGKQK